jgi:hypothetical protein
MMSIVATVQAPYQPGHAPRLARGIVSWCCLGMLFAILATASPVRAQLVTDDCNGLDFDVGKPVIVAKVVSSASKIHYVKRASENASCPAETDTCRSDAYLEPGALVLANSLRAPHTCITYQSPQDTKQIWINGWFPSASLAAIAPLRTPRTADWMGTWSHPGGEIRIEAGDGGKLAMASRPIPVLETSTPAQCRPRQRPWAPSSPSRMMAPKPLAKTKTIVRCACNASTHS